MSVNQPEYGYGGDVPVCPRHPDRPSYIRCQRCGRPACPECQRSAAVGVHCVECVAQANAARQAQAPRSAMGTTVTSHVPFVTYGIMAVCIGMFVLQSTGLEPRIAQLFLFAPGIAFTRPWTFITSGFLHGGIMHLALNMYALWIIGQYLEGALGRWRYLSVFLVSVVGGHVAVTVLTPAMSEGWLWGTLGASGGVFGLFGAVFIVQRRFGGQSAQILVLIGINLVISFLYPQISWEGHIGGLVTGIAAAAAMFAARPKLGPGGNREAAARKSALWHGLIIVGILVLLLAVAYVRWVSVWAERGVFTPFA